MASITLELPPSDIDPALYDYLQRMFNQVSIAVAQNNQLPVLTDLPSKPQDGKLYYFSVTIGATITSVGFWGYEAGSWVKI